jgi:hypothetical protein
MGLHALDLFGVGRVGVIGQGGDFEPQGFDAGADAVKLACARLGRVDVLAARPGD